MNEGNSHQGNKMGYYMARPSMELSTFYGDKSEGWIRRWRKNFKLYFTPANQWVQIASMYLEEGHKLGFMDSF